MAYRSSKSSSGSPSSSSNNASSLNASPNSQNASLAPMARASDEGESLSRSSSARGTPSRVPIDLPRSQAASKGGCWTCRLRRKKCDEQREGESCRTCLRLTIECLGWGPKRPEWMRDKHAVEAYKANIKAQLTRAGLIRGQPRASMLQAQAVAPSGSQQSHSQSRPQAFHRFSAPVEPASSNSTLGLDLDMSFGYRFPDHLAGQHLRHNSFIPGVAGASNSAFHQLPAASYSEPNISSLDIGTSFFQYSPQSSTPLSSLSQDPLDFEFSHIATTTSQNLGGFDFDVRAPSPVRNFPLLAGQNSLQEDHVIYYFENVRKLHFLFGGNTITNVTYTLIVQEPRGAVTNAVCALANLHFTRMRVAQGLEAPDPNPEHSTAKYFHDEALHQLSTTKQIRGSHNESDVLAALHLVCFSQMSGGITDWQGALNIALEWMWQTGLPGDENPRRTLNNMSTAAQLVVKCTMWMDIVSSLSLLRPPKYFTLYRRLLGEKGGYWSVHMPGSEADFSQCGLQMETLTGCPDEAMLGIAEVSALAHWKANELRKGSLSTRELIRRGDDIEQRLRQHRSEPSFGDQAPLHPNLMQASIADSGAITFPTENVRRVLANIFRESVLLYLHTILSDANPAVSDITSSVDTIVVLLDQLPPSEVDRALVFPICLAGCMTDDSARRDYLKARLQTQDENIGNLMRTRVLMEAVWQKRDVGGGAVDWRETMRERGLNLLLM